MAKKPAENVGKLIKTHTKKKLASEVTVGKRMRLRGAPKKPARKKPAHVLWLIAWAKRNK